MEQHSHTDSLLTKYEEELSSQSTEDEHAAIEYGNRRSHPGERHQHLLRLFALILAVLCISLTFVVYIAWQTHTNFCPPHGHDTAKTLDNNTTYSASIANEIPQESVTFSGQTNFSGPPTPASDATWNSLLPAGSGFVIIDDPKSHGLKPGVPTMNGEVSYSVALFHQLHCLGILRSYYWELITAATAHDHDRTYTLAQAQQNSPHTAHCFDYLRQALMFFGDMTLEGARVEADGSRKQVDGWGMEHQCRAWDSIIEWTVRHKGPGTLDDGVIAGQSSLSEVGREV